MAIRTWAGGHNGNDALTADNWSPAGVPRPGDNLTVITGTLNITKTDLAGNKLNLLDDAVGAGPVVLDLNGKARIEAGGSLNFGDPLTVNATGRDSLRADDIFTISGTVDVAAHSDLVVTGSMSFAYFATLEGAGKITNNGTITMADATISAPITGHGVLALHQYHNGVGTQTISGSVSSGQDVQLGGGFYGTVLTLADPSSFHGSLDIVRGPSVAVVLNGVDATGFDLRGHSLTLLNGCTPVDRLRLSNPDAVSISLYQTPNGTGISFAAHG
jgi:hypothetical protein